MLVRGVKGLQGAGHGAMSMKCLWATLGQCA